MKYLSLFSGIEAVSVAWEPLGFEPVAFAEILPFQSSVLNHHFPNTPNLGDVTKIDDETIKGIGKVDVVIFGSPCQDMSVAGRRLGLNTEKEDSNHSSKLFFEGVRIFRLAQKYCGARFMVWENVFGALTSQEGRDFATILETLAGVKFSADRFVWGNEGVVCGANGLCEWSVLDAQWFGVPQRRRRVFVVLDTGNWKYREPILLEADHLRGVVAKDEEKGKNNSESVAGSNGKDSKQYVMYEHHMRDFRIKQTDVSPTVMGHCGTGGNNIPLVQTFDRQGILIWSDNDIASTVSARDYKSPTDLILENSTLRRLTPIETERLQGFPDGWTDVGDASISKRYNALGRSMAVPVMRWIGERIKIVTNNA